MRYDYLINQVLEKVNTLESRILLEWVSHLDKK